MWLDFKDSQLLPRQKLPTPLYNWDSAVSNRQQNTTPQPPTDTLRGYNQDLFSEKKKVSEITTGERTNTESFVTELYNITLSLHVFN